MTVQNSQLFKFNMLPLDVLYCTLQDVCLLDIQSFANTCKDAHRIISQFWSKKGFGFLKKEVQYCLSTSKCIQINFPILFDKASSQLPYLLSSKGLTFQNESGVLMNAKCVFNSNTSTFTFRLIDENHYISVERLKLCSATIFVQNDAIFDQIPTKNSNAYAYKLQTNQSHTFAIINKEDIENNNLFFDTKLLFQGIELCKVKPLNTELSPMPVEIQKFEAEHFNVQKLREAKSPFCWKSFAINIIFFTATACGIAAYAINYFQPNATHTP